MEVPGAQGIELEKLWLLRGPILIAVAVLSVIISIAQSLSLLAMIQLTLLSLGLALLSYDAARMGHDQLRVFVRQQLERVVWDDVMYQFWHPDIEWWRIFVETFVGQASWMYVLPSTSAQRIQLVQAALQVDEQQAQRILFAPGGYKHLLLPKSFVEWLEGDQPENARNNIVEMGGMQTRIADATTEEASGAASSSSSESSPEKECLLDAEPVVIHQEDAIGNCVEDTSTARNPVHSNPESDLPSMSETMKSIVQDAVVDQLREMLTYVPESKHLAGIGVAASAALAIQLGCSSRSRRIALGVLETSTMAGLSAVSMGAASLFLAKTFGPGGSFPINESSVVTYISKVLQMRNVLSRMTARGDGNSDKSLAYKRGFICAVIALMLLGLRKQRQVRR